MHESVSDILILRAREADGMSRMLAVSLTVHVALLAVYVLMPAEWRSASARSVVPLMTISLGGVSGAESGGLTPLADRAVQTVATDSKVQPDTPPAPKAPEMTEPEPVAKSAPKPVKPVAKPAEKSPARKPTSGEEIKAGDARAKTGGAAIPFGGLSTGGAGTGGVRLEVDFCCPEYIQTMVQRIKQTWNPNQGVAGEVWVKFIIRRDGMLTNVEVEKPSGQAMLDLESRRAVLLTRQLPPLPAEFTEPHLIIHLAFSYKR